MSDPEDLREKFTTEMQEEEEVPSLLSLANAIAQSRPPARHDSGRPVGEQQSGMLAAGSPQSQHHHHHHQQQQQQQHCPSANTGATTHFDPTAVMIADSPAPQHLLSHVSTLATIPSSTAGGGGNSLSTSNENGNSGTTTGNCLSMMQSSPPPHSYRHSRSYRHFKNPPQPHMCIRTTTDTGEELFINVLSWTRIVIPQEPSDPIPLYGGMRVPPGSPRSPAIVFAVMANPEVLKDSGRHSKDPEERRAMVELMCDFVEAMNPGVKLVRNAVILKDRDISGELKDVWNAVQAQRDREREEQILQQRHQLQHFQNLTTQQLFPKTAEAAKAASACPPAAMAEIANASAAATNEATLTTADASTTSSSSVSSSSATSAAAITTTTTITPTPTTTNAMPSTTPTSPPLSPLSQQYDNKMIVEHPDIVFGSNSKKMLNDGDREQIENAINTCGGGSGGGGGGASTDVNSDEILIMHQQQQQKQHQQGQLQQKQKQKSKSHAPHSHPNDIDQIDAKVAMANTINTSQSAIDNLCQMANNKLVVTATPSPSSSLTTSSSSSPSSPSTSTTTTSTMKTTATNSAIAPSGSATVTVVPTPTAMPTSPQTSTTPAPAPTPTPAPAATNTTTTTTTTTTTKKDKLGGFLPNGCIFPRFKNNKHKDKDKDKEKEPKTKDKEKNLLHALKKSKEKKVAPIDHVNEQQQRAHIDVAMIDAKTQYEKNCINLENEVEKLDLNKIDTATANNDNNIFIKLKVATASATTAAAAAAAAK